LKFSQFGSDNGIIVIYFHGAPGAPEECAIFDVYAVVLRPKFLMACRIIYVFIGRRLQYVVT